MHKVYGFVWHVVNGIGADCSAFETESHDAIAAATIMHIIVQKDMATCTTDGCEHTPIVTGELTPKMIMSGMTARMRKPQTPRGKREVVLRGISALREFPGPQLAQAPHDFPDAIKRFLDDSENLADPSAGEIKAFDLGADFLEKELPRFKNALRDEMAKSSRPKVIPITSSRRR